MKKINYLPIVILALLLQTLNSYAYNYPIPEIDEVVALTLDQNQASSLITKFNQGTKESPAGVCYGIDRINYTLLTKIYFLEGEIEIDRTIELKLLDAFYSNSNQIISGFKNAKEFVLEMESRWLDETNPLKLAVQEVQLSQNGYENAYHDLVQLIHIMVDGESAFLKDSRILEYHIVSKTPVKISILNSDGAHALTVVGFKRKITDSWGEIVKEFLVLDSNYPTFFQTLKLTEDGWYYEDWDYGDSDGIVLLVIEKPTKKEVNLAQRKFGLHFIYNAELLKQNEDDAESNILNIAIDDIPNLRSIAAR